MATIKSMKRFRLIFRSQGRVKKFSLILILLMSFSVNQASYAQTGIPLNLPVDSAISSTIAFYTRQAGARSAIYNGCEYQFDRINVGHAFFNTARFTTGEIICEDICYPGIPMLYDIVKDVLVIQGLNQIQITTLASNRVNQFTCFGYTFIRKSADSSNKSVPGTGFYQRLYNGRMKVWAKNKKLIEEVTDFGYQLKRVAVEKNRYYIEQKGNYFEVDGKQSVLGILKDKKKEIHHFIAKKKIRFRKDFNSALIQTVAYYCDITN